MFVRIKDDNPYTIPFAMPGTPIGTQPVSSCLFLAFWGSLLCSHHRFETACPRVPLITWKPDPNALSQPFGVSVPRLVLSAPSSLETWLFWFMALRHADSPASLTFPCFLSSVLWPLFLLFEDDGL